MPNINFHKEDFMAYLDNFYLIVGETTMECQRIERDIKLIYLKEIKIL